MHEMLWSKGRSHPQHGCVLSVGIKAPGLVSIGIVPVDVDAAWNVGGGGGAAAEKTMWPPHPATEATRRPAHALGRDPGSFLGGGLGSSEQVDRTMPWPVAKPSRRTTPAFRQRLQRKAKSPWTGRDKRGFGRDVVPSAWCAWVGRPLAHPPLLVSSELAGKP